MKKWLAWSLSFLLAIVVVGGGAAWWALRGSLPEIDGSIAGSATGPDARVTIARDAMGIPTVSGASTNDVAYGLGFAHAQDRFFQMDLSRRLAAGELSALLGSSVLEQDRRARVFRLRRIARQVLADATPAQRAWLEAYARGVNAGVDSLAVRPWEYILLRVGMEPWRAEDCILVVHSMWWFLQYQALVDDVARESIVDRVQQLVAAASKDEADARAAREVLSFLYPRGDEWDAPNFQTRALQAAANGGQPYAAPVIPPPESLDLRALDSRPANAGSSSAALLRESGLPGSNAWAVAGSLTQSGAALIAGDMHLGLRVPATWYRARLQIAKSDTGAIELNGVTLPGLPGIAAGSNGRVAWSFTNSYGDWAGLRSVSCDPLRNVYLTNEGEQRFRLHRETLVVAGDDPEVLEVRDSPLGVVMQIDPPRDAAAGEAHTCWLADWLITHRGATSVVARELQEVADIDSILQLAPQVGIPHQNMIVGDRAGRVAWTIIGRIPRRAADGSIVKESPWLAAGETPTIREPEIGRLWSANARHVEGTFETMLGNDKADSGMHYDKGARQGQIRDRLLALESPATPADMLAIQLDDRAMLVERWQRLLLATLDEDAVRNQPKRAELRRLVADWQGRATPDSVSYRFVREFREKTRGAVWSMITTALGAGQGSQPFPLFEGSLWRLVNEQPPHWLSREYPDWRSLLLAEVDAVIVESEQACATLASCTWGSMNTAAIRHPLSRSLGPLASYLDMPAHPLAGDLHMPRVSGPNFGASERFAVSPGREAEGYLQLPGGASGHPLSPFYRAGFDAWVLGRPQPFLPGAAAHTLVLEARSGS